MALSLSAIPKSWQDLVQDWENYLKSCGKRPATVRLRVRWIRRFARDIGKSPGRVTFKNIKDWSASYDWARETRRTAHFTVALFFEWASDIDRIPANPAVKLEKIKGDFPRPRPASKAVVMAGLDTAPDRVKLMIRLAFELGLRRGEVAQIHAHDLTEDSTGALLIVHGKGGKDRAIPVSDSLAFEIARNSAGSWLFPGQDNGHLSAEYVGTLVRRSLPKGVRMHDLRHSFATRAYSATGDLLAVQQLLGHSSPDTTQRYIAVSGARLREVVSQVAI